MKYTNLQEIIYPSNNIDILLTNDLYFRINNDLAVQDNDEKKITLFKGGNLTTDTYFNSLSVGIWKKYTNIDTVYLKIKAKGKFKFKFMLHRLNKEHVILFSKVLEIENELIIPLRFWKKISEGMLYFSLVSLTDSEFYSANYLTADTPINDVKLGIVVTHFNRKDYVLPAMKRIQNELVNDIRYKSNIELIVVDNSQNITEDESEGATIIPNLNLGGAGGFTRGLLYLKDNNFTNCLFMDDDASCEVESIRRTFALQQFTDVNKFAIAGALLRELESYRMFEKGARFTGICEPLKSNLDMRNIHDLLEAEEEEKIDYGGWWFFSFKISEIENYAFPFFVRGDDSLFSLMNNFDICTMNGIACWGDDFGFKHGVMQNYLDTRYHLVHGIQFLDYSPKNILKRNFLYFLNQLMGYNYSSAKAINLAFEHVLEGPEFWKKNMDMSNIFPILGQISKDEKLEKLDVSELDCSYGTAGESFFRKFVRKITLNGNILPSFLYKNKILFHEKSFGCDSRVIFRYKKVLYYYSPKKMGYIVEYNQKSFFRELIKNLELSIKFYRNFHKIKKQYKDELPHLTSENFWREVYSNKGDKK